MFILPVLGALFGSNAGLLGQMAVVAWNEILYGQLPDKVYEQQDGLFTIGIGFVVLTAAAVVFGKRDAKTADQVVATTATIIIGAVFSILKYVHDTVLVVPGVASADVLAAIGLLIYPVIAFFAFIVPALAAPRPDGAYGATFRLFGRAAAAGLIGLAIGGLVQIAVVAYSKNMQAMFFIVAPTAIGAIMPIWCFAAFDPLLRPQLWSVRKPGARITWIGFYVIATLLLILLYAALNNDFGSNKWWLDVLLFLPSFAGAAVACSLGWFSASSWRWTWAIAIAAVLAAGCAIVAFVVNPAAEPGASFIFVLSHVAASAGAIVGMGLSSRRLSDTAPPAVSIPAQ